MYMLTKMSMSAGGMARVVECLSNKHEAISSNISTATKNRCIC